MIQNYFKTAWRSIWKNRTTSVINITGLSVGMTASILIFLWVQNEMNFDNYHKDADDIYRLTTNLKVNNWTWETSALLLRDAVKKEIPEIEKVARLYDGNWPVFNINNNATYEKECAYVDDEWFSLFKYDFIEGNAAAFSGDINSIILTASTAKKYFGNRNAMGTTIRVDSMSYVVKGIVKDAPANSSFQYTSFIPLANLLKDKDRRENDERWENANYITFIKVKAGSNENVLAKKITDVFAKSSGDKETTISLVPLKAIHFETEIQNSVFVHGSKTTVYIFIVLAFLLLLIACINYVNLTTAKASLRAKEVSVRKMIGAKRINLFYLFVTESVLISIISLASTLALLQLCLPVFNTLTGKVFELPLTSLDMWRVMGITLLVALLLNSIYPALVLSSFKPLNVFRGFTVLKIKDSYFRKSLVTVQFTISVMLITGTLIIYKQMQFIQQTDPGYNKSQVLTFPLPPNVNNENKNALIQTIKQNLLAKSSIESVAVSNQSVEDIGSVSTGSADWDGHDTSYNPKIAQLATDADFASTLQLQMKEGRWFLKSNVTDENNVVLNEEAVKALNIHKPVIGQRFSFKGKTGQIIGVVKDFNYKSMHDKTGPLVAFNNPNWFRFFTVRVASGNAEKAIHDVQDIWKQLLPGTPLEYSFLDDSFNQLYSEDQKTSSLIFAFAVIAIAVSCLGLFGLAAFTAEQRSKEIGIRKVLGATVTNLTALISKDFIKLVCIAIVIATPISFMAMNAWIQNFAYRIDISWWMFAAAGLLALLIALITVSFQSVKAAIANPVKSLRTE
ncbi:MAG TPA: ABC transporter permease [Panacibacter sp.]|nr:ABC transporter permease [Panacibacter sp.]